MSMSNEPVTVGWSSSAPPQSIASWRPERIRSQATPIACRPEAQAALVDSSTPCRPRNCARFIATVWERHWKNCIDCNCPKSRSGSRVSKTWLSAMALPVVDPATQPVRPSPSVAGSARASRSASCAACAAKRLMRPIERRLCRGIARGSRSTAGAATRLRRPL